MGPFPHDAPPAEISAGQPSRTERIRFVGFAAPTRRNSNTLPAIGFFHGRRATGEGEDRVWRQGNINYIVNAEPGSHAMRFVRRTRPLRAVHRLVV